MSEKEPCVVVGVGPGIGLAVARRFAAEGHPVALVARTQERLAEHEAVLEKDGFKARSYTADCGRTADVRHALSQVKADLGDPGVLVYNAAAVRPGLPSVLPAERLIDELRVNVAGALTAAQGVLFEMKEKKRGTILFTGGGLALDPWSEMASLAVGKAGIRSLALSLAKELEPAGIHVATVTVCGIVEAGGRFDPERIAAAFYELHAQPESQWERERVID